MADEKPKRQMLFDSLTTAHLPRMPSGETASATTAHLTAPLGVLPATLAPTAVPVQAAPSTPPAAGPAKTDG